MSSALVLVGVLVAIALLLHPFVERSRERRISKLPLPPGPKQLPIFGNTLQLKKEYTWRQYLDWSKQHGPIFTLNAAGNTFIVLANAQVAQDVLNKNAIHSSNRPPLPMANDLVTKGMHMLLRPYDASYRLHQRMHATVLSPRAAASFSETYESHSRHLLLQLISGGPEPDFARLFANYNLAVIYSLVYGIEIKTGEEECVARSRAVQQDFQRTMTPGAYLVDTIPSLNHLPHTIAPWKAEAERLFHAEASLHTQNLDAGLSGKDKWNFAKQFDSSAEARNMSRTELAYSLGILTNAGFDTLKIMLEWFVVACLTYPETVKQARAAIDRVVPHDRLPLLSDRDQIPYITAMVEETLRWRSILNGGFPHVATEEIEYQGYCIPKGAILLPHFWAIDHDENVYQRPQEFDPERWLLRSENGTISGLANSSLAAFGFGRRICTGRNIARNTLWLVIARLIWAFDIRNAVDDEGNEIGVDPEAMDPGINTKVAPFKARFVPRGDWVKEGILGELDNSEAT